MTATYLIHPNPDPDPDASWLVILQTGDGCQIRIGTGYDDPAEALTTVNLVARAASQATIRVAPSPGDAVDPAHNAGGEVSAELVGSWLTHAGRAMVTASCPAERARWAARVDELTRRLATTLPSGEGQR